MSITLDPDVRIKAEQWIKENVITTWDDVNHCFYFIMNPWIEDPDAWYEAQVKLMAERAPA